MPTTLESLEAIKATILEKLAEVPKPDVSEEGFSVNWSQYRARLWQELQEVNEQIEREEAASTGWAEEETVGVL